MRKEITYSKLHKERKLFMRENFNKDHVILNGEKNILISAPHGVPQLRLGKYKYSEIGSLTAALKLQKETDCYFIAKTKSQDDDANFDEVSAYKDSIKKLVEEKNISFVLDFHGLAASRECDVNLGTHLGHNIETNLEAFNLLNNMLEEKGFVVFIDKPFMGGGKTICNTVKKQFPNVWALQVEINCRITNSIKNFEKFKKLLEVFTNWINTI